MATTLATLRADFFSRGFDPMNDGGAGAARADRYLNQSYLTLCARADFPWLYADASGTAPLTVADVRSVLSCELTAAPSTPLAPQDRAVLVDKYGDLTTAGTPRYVYRDSSTVFKVYPVQAVSITVRYLKKPAALSAPTDVVVVPDEWADLIVDGAVVRAKKGKDDYDQYVQQFEVDVQRMVVAEVDDGSGSGYVVDYGGSGDWSW